MDPQQLQSFGLFGVFRLSFSLLHSRGRLFSHIALALVLPVSFLFLALAPLSALFISSTVSSDDDYSSRHAAGIARHPFAYLLFTAGYLLFELLVFLLALAAVVYAAACAYAAKSDATLRKVLGVVPRVWVRLLVTYLWFFLALVVYNVIAIVALVAVGAVARLAIDSPSGAVYGLGIALLVVAILIYLAGLVYISVVWHLASAVSVLEVPYGAAAMRKGRGLLKGKVWLVAVIFVLFHVVLEGIDLVWRLAVFGGSWPVKVVAAVALLAVLTAVILLGLVVLTAVYLVCKAYHNEGVDRASLSEQLDGYVGEYERIRRGGGVTPEMQMGQQSV